jgi:cytochrome c-type biogenesis protein CcmH
MRWIILILILTVTPLWAVEPEEMLADPVLEARARALSGELRCPICRNESIDESHAPLARELRVVLRERLSAGDSDAQIKTYMVARYGEFVLLRPNTEGVNLLLWLVSPTMLIIALGVGWATIRKRGTGQTDPLTEDEQEALEKILRS